MRHERHTGIVEHTFTLTEEEAWALTTQLGELMENSFTGYTEPRYVGTPAYELRKLLGKRNHP